MKKCLLTLLSPLLFLLPATAQKTLKRELRGAWVATYANIDWPNRAQTPQQQRDAFITLINHHQATGINAVYVQVRSQCDALYPSSIDPWSADLTGTQGKAPAPFWDPLQFMIDECHKRGIEFHAWINPYRAIANYNNIGTFAANHVARQHPEWLIASGTLRTLDPGIPAVRDYINSVITDIVQRYDVDGIHFDDYFYPNAAFTDDATYAADPRGITDRGDWRRDNVNLLIQRINQSISHLKPWVKFGVSPSGIYRNSTNPEIGSATSGLQHYVTLYADSRKWLQQGWVDYIEPQVYWYIGQGGADYKVLIPWWNNNAYGRHIYIGLAGYKVADPAQGANWANPSQIPNEVRMNRDAAYQNIFGQSVYNTSSLRSNKLGFRDSLRQFFYSRPALLPAMPWKDAVAPAAPSALTAVKYANDSVVLSWTPPASASSELDKVKQYVVYRSESATVDTADAAAILAITPGAATTFTDKTIAATTTYYYTVTALDRLHNESASTNTADNLPPRITCPANQTLYVNATCAAVVPDYRLAATVQSSAGTTTLSQLPAPGSAITGVGSTSITLTATDAGGNSSSCQFTVQALDTLAPVITAASANPNILNAYNHKLRTITVNYTAADNCGPVSTTLSVSSNEPANGAGDGNTASDWEIVNAHQVKLRAERSGVGSDRVYTITVTATDASGNKSTQDITVTVPHHPAVTTQAGSSAVAEEATETKELVLSVLPNPTTDRFVLTLQSSSTEPVRMKVTDNAGRMIEQRKGLAANSAISFGGKYRTGVYFVEVVQGNRIKTIKLIKQKN